MSTPGAYFRLVKLGWVLVREGVVSALPVAEMPPIMRFGHSIAGIFARKRSRTSTQSDNLSRAVERLGPSYVKIGQFLATRPDVVGNEFAADLALLQDRMETFPTRLSRAQIEASLGRSVGDLFAEFGEPVAAASIAQVHPATVIRDGVPHKVAVKVIRPGVRERFNRDLEAQYLVSRLQERFHPPSRRLRPVEVTRTL